MSITKQVRYNVRRAFNFHCGYCGVSENRIGSELDVDHFQPTSRGGTDDFDNLICTCAACNRFKSYYWPPPNAPESLHLLHPLKDDLKKHIVEVADGQLIGLTTRGWFHIGLLHLNRPQLVVARQQWRKEQLIDQMLVQQETLVDTLQERMREKEVEVIELRETITRLLRGNG
jgi:hypothetical protein